MLAAKGEQMNFYVDYSPAEECKNPNVWYMCQKCGLCGRVFEDGIMINDGGTHEREEDE